MTTYAAGDTVEVLTASNDTARSGGTWIEATVADSAPEGARYIRVQMPSDGGYPNPPVRIDSDFVRPL